MNAGVPALGVCRGARHRRSVGLPADATFAPPLIVMTMIFAGAASRHGLPVLSRAFARAPHRYLERGPLGFWAMMALIAAAAPARAFARRRSRPEPALALLGVRRRGDRRARLAGSLYVVRLIDAWPMPSAHAFRSCFPVVLRGVVWIKRRRLRPASIEA